MKRIISTTIVSVIMIMAMLSCYKEVTCATYTQELEKVENTDINQ